MHGRQGDLGRRIRGLVWAAPVIAVWQSGCGVMSGGSCDGFHSTPFEQRFPFQAGDAGFPDAGVPTSPEACVTYCNGTAGPVDSCRVETADGGLVVVCQSHTMCTGRRPEGFDLPSPDWSVPLLGRHFARMAAAEAASIIAFEHIAEELREHGMPEELAARALRAATEEGRHFRAAARLAARFGAPVETGTVTPRRPRSLFDLARENAREGLVRETIGAAFGWWQAEHAGEASVRRAMQRIARDETSHAELSWDLDRAARRRLTRSERREIDQATRRALHDTERELEAPVEPELVSRAGVPARDVAAALFATARAELYASG